MTYGSLEINSFDRNANWHILGVLHWSEIFGGDSDPILEKIKSDRGYSYTDTIIVSPDKLPNYEGIFLPHTIEMMTHTSFRNNLIPYKNLFL